MGKQYGSLTNFIVGTAETHENIVPTVGMGCTEVHWSDRHAYTIVEVDLAKKKFWMTRDDAKRTDKNGMSDSQHYEYTPDPNGHRVEVKYHKTRKSKHNPNPFGGHWKSDSGYVVWLNARDEYYDYSF